MTQYEMTENLSEKMNVSLEEAKSALDEGEWNVLTATHLLEQEQFRRKQELDEVASSCEAMTEEAAAEEKAEQAESAEPAQAKKRPKGQGMKNLGEHLRRFVAWGNRNRFEVHKGDAALLQMPVTALAVLMLCAFWACAILMVVGLFAGCRYSVGGREFGLNKADAGSATQA